MFKKNVKQKIIMVLTVEKKAHYYQKRAQLYLVKKKKYFELV